MMLSVIALIGNDMRSRIVLLPLEQGSSFQAQDWLNLLDGEDMIVTNQLFPLVVGDWIVRSLQQAVREGQLQPTNIQLKSYIAQLLLSIGHQKVLSWRCYSALEAVDGEDQSKHRHAKVTEARLSELLLEWLQGRKLLYDEWLALAQERMEEYNAGQGGEVKIEQVVVDRQVTNRLVIPPLTTDHLDVDRLTIEQLKGAWRSLVMKGSIQLRSAVEWSKRSTRSTSLKLRCLRCYETKLVHAERNCRYCGENCYYCNSCLQMGRARTCAALIIANYHSPIRTFIQNKNTSSPEHLLQLEAFGLSEAQHMATTTALRFVHEQLQASYGNRGASSKEDSGRSSDGRMHIHHRLNDYRHLLSKLKAGSEAQTQDLSSQFLLWAVTGAGKTEMIFPLIAYMMKLGGSVLLATPRRDVVLELSPRLRKAFPDCSIVTLYGGSKDRWQRGQLFLATTHQLMRFQHAFDLVIIDELDAFPYHGDERLYRVASQARVPAGVTILLSATPPAYLQREMNRGRLAHVKLPVRYHRHPLPVPIRLKTPLVVEQLSKQLIPSSLQQALIRSLKEDAQIFIFLQRIVHTEAYAELLRRIFPDINIQATSSQDVHRTSKVTAFRQRDIRILVTTTILERGVTVPRSHVYICDAEAELFDEAALVQMAGRAGRSGDAPNGAVYFLSQQWSSAQKRAIRQIQSMNGLALKQGYLLPQYQQPRLAREEQKHEQH